ncbi:transporter [Vibrio cionasavignyae]|uniref:transporter n=1 Tax=Vibrio cionasavignyae TaxID=2910252 RepID=UPI003D11EAC3
MRKLLIIAVSLSAAFAVSANHLDRETTSFQPGLNAGANAAKRTGDGFFGSIIYNNYRSNTTDENGQAGGGVDVYTMFNGLNYNTTWEVLGAKYSIGAIVPIGEVHSRIPNAGNVSSGIKVGEPVLMPAQLYWEGEKLNVTARWFYRSANNGVLDKPYETHQLMTAATYDVSGYWQLNGAVAYELRGKHTAQNNDVRPGNILTLDGSVVRKFEGGYSLGLLGYHMSNDTTDRGHSYRSKDGKPNKYGANPHRGTLTGYGVEIAVPVSAQSGVSMRVFNELNSKTSTQGTRLFLSYGHQF